MVRKIISYTDITDTDTNNRYPLTEIISVLVLVWSLKFKLVSVRYQLGISRGISMIPIFLTILVWYEFWKGVSVFGDK